MAATVSIKNADGVEDRWLKEEAPRADAYLAHLVHVGSQAMRVTGLDQDQHLDRDVHILFRKFFPSLDVRVLQPHNPMNGSDDVNFWIPLLTRVMKKLVDSKMLTMLRIDCTRGYTSDNIWLVPKVKFYAIEVARCREGLNDEFIRRCRRNGTYPFESSSGPESHEPALCLTRTSRFTVLGLSSNVIPPPTEPLVGALEAVAAELAAAAAADDADLSSPPPQDRGGIAAAAAAASEVADAVVEKEMESIVQGFDDPYGNDWPQVKVRHGRGAGGGEPKSWDRPVGD